MQPGQQLRLGPVMDERVVRMVMIGDDGNSADIIYDMAPGLPRSGRVLRLENVNGMLQGIYDYGMPTRPLASAGLPRLVQQGGGMYEVVYNPQQGQTRDRGQRAKCARTCRIAGVPGPGPFAEAVQHRADVLQQRRGDGRIRAPRPPARPAGRAGGRAGAARPRAARSAASARCSSRSAMLRVRGSVVSMALHPAGGTGSPGGGRPRQAGTAAADPPRHPHLCGLWQERGA
jgi:hypothetical protein